jgi:hypothetical protein
MAKPSGARHGLQKIANMRGIEAIVCPTEAMGAKLHHLVLILASRRRASGAQGFPQDQVTAISFAFRVNP